MTAISEPRKSTPPSLDAPAPVPRGRVLLRVLVATAAFLGLVAFAAVLARLTLTPSPASESIAGANLRPGHSLRQYAEDYTFLAACKQLGGNLLLGAPFGLLLPLLVPRRLRMLRMVLLTAVVMSLVELVQGAIVPGRAFDVDDVILNTSGAFLAYLLLGRRVSRRYHHALARRTAPAATDDGTRPTTGPDTVPVAPAAPDDHTSPDARTAPDAPTAPDTRPVPDGPVRPGPRLSKPERTKDGAVARAAARLRRRDR